MKQYLFPTAIFALSLGAAIVYALHGDWRRAVYWTAAAIITAAVTL